MYHHGINLSPNPITPQKKPLPNPLLLLRQIPIGIQILNNLPHSLLNRQIIILNMNLGLLRRLIRRTHTSKLLNNAIPGLLIQTLRIPLLSHLNGDINVDLQKRQPLILTGGSDLMQGPGGVTVRLVGRDKRGDGDGRAVREQLGHFGYPPDVLVAVFLAESQVLVQPEPDVVAVETVGGDIALAQELVLQFDGDRRLAGG